jgi:hypothetical protein
VSLARRVGQNILIVAVVFTPFRSWDVPLPNHD